MGGRTNALLSFSNVGKLWKTITAHVLKIYHRKHIWSPLYMYSMFQLFILYMLILLFLYFSCVLNLLVHVFLDCFQFFILFNWIFLSFFFCISLLFKTSLYLYSWTVFTYSFSSFQIFLLWYFSYVLNLFVHVFLNCFQFFILSIGYCFCCMSLLF